MRKQNYFSVLKLVLCFLCFAGSEVVFGDQTNYKVNFLTEGKQFTRVEPPRYVYGIQTESKRYSIHYRPTFFERLSEAVKMEKNDKRIRDTLIAEGYLVKMEGAPTDDTFKTERLPDLCIYMFEGKEKKYAIFAAEPISKGRSIMIVPPYTTDKQSINTVKRSRFAEATKDIPPFTIVDVSYVPEILNEDEFKRLLNEKITGEKQKTARDLEEARRPLNDNMYQPQSLLHMLALQDQRCNNLTAKMQALEKAEGCILEYSAARLWPEYDNERQRTRFLLDNPDRVQMDDVMFYGGNKVRLSPVLLPGQENI